MNIYKMKQYAVSALLLLGTASCETDFLKEASQDLAKVETWQDLDEVLLGSAYMQTDRVNPTEYSYSEIDYGDGLDILHFMTDEIKESGDDYNDLLGYPKQMFPYYTWQQDTGMDEDFKFAGGDEKYWDMLYEKINVTNMVIALIDEQAEANQDDRDGKARVKGEAYFLRAAYYFLLVNLYGQPYTAETAATVPGVPIKLTEYVEDAIFERNSVAEVYNQINADLDVAEACLANKTRKSVYHANLTAAYLLHSRVHLYMQHWEKAAEYAQKVLNEQSSLLDLHIKSPGDDCLYASSPETIFSMGGYIICAAFNSSSRRYEPSLYISDEMVDLYANDDLRGRLYIGVTNNGYPNVFMKVNGQSDHWGRYYETSSCFLLRTPEAYLTLAEASAYAGDEATAQRTLETFLRTRMSGNTTVTQSGNELIDLIRNERAREFLLEGHRWFDLRRYTVCKPYPWSKTIEHGHIYFADYAPDHADWYRLEQNDQAYTLPIPRQIRSFQISLGNNERPARPSYFTENY